MKISKLKAMFLNALVVICVLISMMQQGCGSSDESESETGALLETTQLPEATADSIWKYISVDNRYEKWNTFPSERIPESLLWKDDYVTCWLAGNVNKIYVNDIALAALYDQPRDMPKGSIIISEIYHILPDDTLGDMWLIGGFYKFEGSTDTDNDWVSFEYGPEGNLLYTCASITGFGTKTKCYDCHEASENDYIWIDSPKLDASRSQVPTLDECEVRP
jgi:hypothetical protein